MEYLHAEGLIHGDLRGSNILVDNDHHPRLADFGLGSIAESTAGSHTSKGGGSIRWMAPELLRAEGDFQRTLPTDVYSYGCVCVEVRHNMSSIPYLLLNPGFSCTHIGDPTPMSSLTCTFSTTWSTLDGGRLDLQKRRAMAL
jgi:serine/threonine protein kinase